MSISKKKPINQLEPFEKPSFVVVEGLPFGIRVCCTIREKKVVRKYTCSCV